MAKIDGVINGLTISFSVTFLCQQLASCYFLIFAIIFIQITVHYLSSDLCRQWFPCCKISKNKYLNENYKQTTQHYVTITLLSKCM